MTIQFQDLTTQNPFYNNPVFEKKDVERCKIRWHHRLWLWLLPTNVQLADGYIFYWKRWQGQIFLLKVATPTPRA